MTDSSAGIALLKHVRAIPLCAIRIIRRIIIVVPDRGNIIGKNRTDVVCRKWNNENNKDHCQQPGPVQGPSPEALDCQSKCAIATQPTDVPGLAKLFIISSQVRHICAKNAMPDARCE